MTNRVITLWYRSGLPSWACSVSSLLLHLAPLCGASGRQLQSTQDLRFQARVHLEMLHRCCC